MASATALALRDDVEYPDSDGQPMAETDPHREDMTYLVDALRYHFRDRPDIYVSGNLFLYYQEGDPSASVAPDVFVVVGVAPHQRKTYRLWEEGVAPCLVVEVTSDSTRLVDERKKKLYARLGVREYFRFDPYGEYLEPRLQGYRLAGPRKAGPRKAGPRKAEPRYRRMPPLADDSLRSRTLGLVLTLDGDRLRVVDVASGEPLLRFEEEAASRRAAEREVVLLATRSMRHATEAARLDVARQAAEERAEREATRAEREAARAEREAARAEQEAARAEQEATARHVAEEGRRKAEERSREMRAEIERLRARR